MRGLSRVVALFPGQGTQYVGMGKHLCETFPAAAAVFEEADQALGRPLAKLMWDGPAEELTLTQNAQPAILTLSVAMAKCLETEGVLSPSVPPIACAVGHSLGEFSALVFAGCVSLTTAVRLVALRGRLMQRAGDSVGEPVAMSALLACSPSDVAAMCKAESLRLGTVVEVAAFNAKDQVAISGTARGVAAVEDAAKAAGIARRCVRMSVSAPFHSSLLLPIAAEFRDAVGAVPLLPPRIPLLSCMTARPFEPHPPTMMDLLAQQVWSPVRWRECMQRHEVAEAEASVEIGPGRVLSALLTREDPQFKTHLAADLLGLPHHP